MRAIRTAVLSLLAIVAFGLVGPRPADAQYTLTTLASFNGANGAEPLSGVVRDAQGNLFGTTNRGGANDLGTAWELAAGSNTPTTLATFKGANGANPVAGLTLDPQGNLFGTTELGGPTWSPTGPFGFGTVFELAAGGHTFTTLASFNGANGAAPTAVLTLDAQGNLFGTANEGGPPGGAGGTVFELAAGSRTLTALASFNDRANGAIPFTNVVRDAQGNLFGTTGGGGANGYGTVFELAAGSRTITTLASFNGTNGSNPTVGLTRDAQGNLFGITSSGGIGFNPANPTSGSGTVWKLAAGSRMITTLASFNGANGASPLTCVVRDAQGNLFGTTEAGGAFNQGTVWELAAGSRAITTLVSFNGANGTSPVGNLARDARGNFYGTTKAGGANNLGTVFELSPVPKP